MKTLIVHSTDTGLECRLLQNQELIFAQTIEHPAVEYPTVRVVVMAAAVGAVIRLGWLKQEDENAIKETANDLGVEASRWA